MHAGLLRTNGVAAWADSGLLKAAEMRGTHVQAIHNMHGMGAWNTAQGRVLRRGLATAGQQLRYSVVDIGVRGDDGELCLRDNGL